MYTTNFVYKAPTAVLESLKKLLQVLGAEKAHLEQAALIADNRQLKNTLVQFLQESNQYINELKCQIESLGERVESNNEIDMNAIKKIQSTQEIYEYCGECEKKIVDAYREIINQPIIVKELRRMIRYQLNGLLCAFIQLKLLKDSFIPKKSKNFN